MSSFQIHSQTSPTDVEPPPAIFEPAENDSLPPYTNNLLLASLCRRKREFQATFDKTPRGRRTWELVWLVLDGTALRVYRPKSQEKKAVENTELGLVRMGSGESTRSTPMSKMPRVLEGRRGALLDQSRQSGEASPAGALVSASEPQLQFTQWSRDDHGPVDSSMPSPSIQGQARPAGRGHRRMNSITKGAPTAPPAYSSHPMTTPLSECAPFLPPPAAPATAFLPPTAPPAIATPEFSRRKAWRQYHLQHAICMKADAYTKREHVLRFILEDGKQFIVQFSNRAETISWLQLMSIASPLSLDLDERPMPEPAHYPRRRPRLRAQRRPSTAPGALDPSTPATTQGSSDPLSAMGTIPPIPSVPDTDSGLAVVGGEGRGEGEDDEEEEDGEGDPLIIEEDMDHLPPPRRPALPRSLSSVEQARRRGIQL